MRNCDDDISLLATLFDIAVGLGHLLQWKASSYYRSILLEKW
jgi:hypothetical protein